MPAREVHPRPPLEARRPLQGLRTFCYLFSAFWITAVSFAIAAPLMLLDPKKKRPADFVIRGWSLALLWIAGVRVVVEGREHADHPEARLLVGNHASFFDPPTLWFGHPRQIRFVLKKELVRIPFVGWYAWLGNHILLDRSNPREGGRLLEASVARCKALGISPLVFPEGTRSRDGALGEMKNGAFQMALGAGLPIQPVALLGSFAVWPKSTLAPCRAGTITVRYGPPISTEGLKGGRGRKAAGEAVHEALVTLGVPTT